MKILIVYLPKLQFGTSLMDKIRFSILGCGSSGGVPRIGNSWGACDPNNPRNNRKRCSLLIQRFGKNGVTNILIDTSPDMRQQLLDANIGNLDAVIYTHEHADHLHGLDDLRIIVLNRGKRLPIYAAKRASIYIQERFSYAFATPKNSPYPPILSMHKLENNLVISGDGGRIDITTFDVEHGSITCSAICVSNVLYTPDISGISKEIEKHIFGLDCWILDALRYATHPSHSHFEQSLQWIKKYKPNSAILTNMHIDLDYETLCQNTPKNVTPAYDGLQFEKDID